MESATRKLHAALTKLLSKRKPATYNNVFRSGDCLWDWLGLSLGGIEDIRRAAALATELEPAGTVLESFTQLAAKVARAAHKGKPEWTSDWPDELRNLVAMVMFSPLTGELESATTDFMYAVDEEWNELLEEDSEDEDEVTGETNREAYEAFEWGRNAWTDRCGGLRGEEVMDLLKACFNRKLDRIEDKHLERFELEVGDLLDGVGSLE